MIPNGLADSDPAIAYGLIAGIFTYILLNGIPWVIEKLSGGRIKPPGKDESEAWTWKVEGGLIPHWIKRAARGKKDFWREDEEVPGIEKRSDSDNGPDSHEIADLEGVVAGRAKVVEKGGAVA